jgi:hypothetical protein
MADVYRNGDVGAFRGLPIAFDRAPRSLLSAVSGVWEGLAGQIFGKMIHPPSVLAAEVVASARAEAPRPAARGRSRP